MDDVLLKYNLERKDLDFKCPHQVRDRIAREIVPNWILIGCILNVSDQRLTSIGVDFTRVSPEEKAIAALDAWAEEHGNNATYLKLAEALYDRQMTRALEILVQDLKPTRQDPLLKATVTDAEACHVLAVPETGYGCGQDELVVQKNHVRNPVVAGAAVQLSVEETGTSGGIDLKVYI